MKPLVSILVTTYNVENFVERAVRSALAQTYPSLEIVIVDDCSDDGTWEKLQRFSKKVTLIRHIERKRVSAALNTALGRAHGDYIARLDGDDQLYPTLIEEEVAILQARPEYGFVYCDYEEVNAAGKVIRKVSLPEFSPKLVHEVDYIAMGNLVRRECYEMVGSYDEEMKKQEHYDWSIRLVENYKGIHLPKILFTYTRHSAQATANKDDLRSYTERVRKKYNLKRDEVVRW